MKRLSLLSLAAAAFASSVLGTTATAQPSAAADARPTTVDLATFDCRTLLRMNGEYRDNAILFLHGYVSGQKKQTVIELGPIATATDRIIDYCISNPDAKALTASEANR